MEEEALSTEDEGTARATAASAPHPRLILLGGDGEPLSPGRGLGGYKVCVSSRKTTDGCACCTTTLASTGFPGL